MLPPAVLELLLQASFRRDLPGFKQTLSDLMQQVEIPAWGLLFPPSVPAGGRHLLIAHAVRADGPCLRQLSRSDLEMLYPVTAAARQTWEQLARELAPAAYPQAQVLYIPRAGGNQLGLTFFVFQAVGSRYFQVPEKLRQLAVLGQHLLNCFGQMAERAEHQFTAGLLRTVGHLHSEGLCLLQADGKVLFANRTFREQIHLCHHGPGALQSINLPAQLALPEVWQHACRRCSEANRESMAAAGEQDPSASGRVFIKVNVPLGSDEEVVGTVQLPTLPTSIGPRSFFLLKSRVEKLVMRRTRDADQLWRDLGLSRREIEVARHVVQGLSAEQLAARLSISVTTVKTHLQSIFHKAGVRSRLQLAALLHGPASPVAAAAKPPRRAASSQRLT